MILKLLQKKLFGQMLKEASTEQGKLQQQVASLEKEMSELKKLIQLQNAKSVKKQVDESTVIIEHVTIENLNIENADLSNNFGQLGINELAGQLYIGTTSGVMKKPQNLISEAGIRKPSSSPKVQIKSKGN